MRFIGTAIITWIIGAFLSIVLGVQPVLAWCTSNSQCSNETTCQNWLIPWFKECKRLPCNMSFQPGFDAQSAQSMSMCPSDRPSCELGICIGPASSGSGGGSGISQGDEGGRCGEIKLGLVTKNVGCKPGLQCVKVPASSRSGTCQRPPS